MMQNRYSTLLDRVIESGIRQKIDRQNFAFYKMIRSDLLYRMNAMNNSEKLLKNDVLSPTLMLSLVVLSFGYTMSTLALAIEIFWTARSDVYFPN